MPHHLQPQIKQRLYALSLRAFEFFAGDLLTFMGLAAVTVTRYRVDGGIDASCELVSGGFLRVPAGAAATKAATPSNTSVSAITSPTSPPAPASALRCG